MFTMLRRILLILIIIFFINVTSEEHRLGESQSFPATDCFVTVNGSYYFETENVWIRNTNGNNVYTRCFKFHDSMYELYYANSNSDEIVNPKSYIQYIEEAEGFPDLLNNDISESIVTGMLPHSSLPEESNTLLLFNVHGWNDDEYFQLTFMTHQSLMYILSNTYPYKSCQTLPGGEYIIVETKFISYKIYSLYHDEKGFGIRDCILTYSDLYIENQPSNYPKYIYTNLYSVKDRVEAVCDKVSPFVDNNIRAYVGINNFVVHQVSFFDFTASGSACIYSEDLTEDYPNYNIIKNLCCLKKYQNTDFQNWEAVNETGYIEQTLNSDKLPYTLTKHYNMFDLWFRKSNYSYPIKLNMFYEINPNYVSMNYPSFYPLTGVENLQPLSLLEEYYNLKCWFTFTTSFYAIYTKDKDKTISVTTTMNLWLYLNEHLIVDLSVTHAKNSINVSLYDIGQELNLSVGEVYKLDFFVASRYCSSQGDDNAILQLKSNLFALCDIFSLQEVLCSVDPSRIINESCTYSHENIQIRESIYDILLNGDSIFRYDADIYEFLIFETTLHINADIFSPFCFYSTRTSYLVTTTSPSVLSRCFINAHGVIIYFESNLIKVYVSMTEDAITYDQPSFIYSVNTEDYEDMTIKYSLMNIYTTFSFTINDIEPFSMRIPKQNHINGGITTQVIPPMTGGLTLSSPTVYSYKLYPKHIKPLHYPQFLSVEAGKSISTYFYVKEDCSTLNIDDDIYERFRVEFRPHDVLETNIPSPEYTLSVVNKTYLAVSISGTYATAYDMYVYFDNELTLYSPFLYFLTIVPDSLFIKNTQIRTPTENITVGNVVNFYIDFYDRYFNPVPYTKFDGTYTLISSNLAAFREIEDPKGYSVVYEYAYYQFALQTMAIRFSDAAGYMVHSLSYSFYTYLDLPSYKYTTLESEYDVIPLYREIIYTLTTYDKYYNRISTGGYAIIVYITSESTQNSETFSEVLDNSFYKYSVIDNNNGRYSIYLTLYEQITNGSMYIQIMNNEGMNVDLTYKYLQQSIHSSLAQNDCSKTSYYFPSLRVGKDSYFYLYTKDVNNDGYCQDDRVNLYKVFMQFNGQTSQQLSFYTFSTSVYKDIYKNEYIYTSICPLYVFVTFPETVSSGMLTIQCTDSNTLITSNTTHTFNTIPICEDVNNVSVTHNEYIFTGNELELTINFKDKYMNDVITPIRYYYIRFVYENNIVENYNYTSLWEIQENQKVSITMTHSGYVNMIVTASSVGDIYSDYLVILPSAATLENSYVYGTGMNGFSNCLINSDTFCGFIDILLLDSLNNPENPYYYIPNNDIDKTSLDFLIHNRNNNFLNFEIFDGISLSLLSASINYSNISSIIHIDYSFEKNSLDAVSPSIYLHLSLGDIEFISFKQIYAIEMINNYNLELLSTEHNYLVNQYDSSTSSSISNPILIHLTNNGVNLTGLSDSLEFVNTEYGSSIGRIVITETENGIYSCVPFITQIGSYDFVLYLNNHPVTGESITSTITIHIYTDISVDFTSYYEGTINTGGQPDEERYALITLIDKYNNIIIPPVDAIYTVSILPSLDYNYTIHDNGQIEFTLYYTSSSIILFQSYVVIMTIKTDEISIEKTVFSIRYNNYADTDSISSRSFLTYSNELRAGEEFNMTFTPVDNHGNIICSEFIFNFLTTTLTNSKGDILNTCSLPYCTGDKPLFFVYDHNAIYTKLYLLHDDTYTVTIKTQFPTGNVVTLTYDLVIPTNLPSPYTSYAHFTVNNQPVFISDIINDDPEDSTLFERTKTFDAGTKIFIHTHIYDRYSNSIKEDVLSSLAFIVYYTNPVTNITTQVDTNAVPIYLFKNIYSTLFLFTQSGVYSIHISLLDIEIVNSPLTIIIQPLTFNTVSMFCNPLSLKEPVPDAMCALDGLKEDHKSFLFFSPVDIYGNIVNTTLDCSKFVVIFTSLKTYFLDTSPTMTLYSATCNIYQYIFTRVTTTHPSPLGAYELQIIYNNGFYFPIVNMQLYPSYIGFDYTKVDSKSCTEVGNLCSVNIYFSDMYNRTINFDFFNVTLELVSYPTSNNDENQLTELIYTENAELIKIGVIEFMNETNAQTFTFACTFVNNSYQCDYALYMSGHYEVFYKVDEYSPVAFSFIYIYPDEPVFTNLKTYFISDSNSINNVGFILLSINDKYNNPVSIEDNNITSYFTYTVDSYGKQRSLNITMLFLKYSRFVYILPFRGTLYGQTNNRLDVIQSVYDSSSSSLVNNTYSFDNLNAGFMEPQLCRQWDTRIPYMCYNNKQISADYPVLLHYNNYEINCVPNVTFCHNDYICEEHKVACPNYSPTYFVPSMCQKDVSECHCQNIKCSTGQCVDNLADCPYIRPVSDSTSYVCIDEAYHVTNDMCSQPISCPPSTILCEDLISCGTSIEDCRKHQSIKKCPSYAPILCWDEVTCVAFSSSCPSLSFCPEPFILCPDNTCARTIEECSFTECSVSYPYHCLNYCVNDIDKCPSTVSCPLEYHLNMMGNCILDDVFIFYDIYNYNYDKNFIRTDIFNNREPYPVSVINTDSNTVDDNTIVFNEQYQNGLETDTVLMSTHSYIQVTSSTGSNTVTTSTRISTLVQSFNMSFTTSYTYIPYKKTYNESLYLTVFTECPRNMYKCFDNSCVVTMSDCPTIVKCPPPLVLCEDQTCKAFASLCVPSTPCPSPFISCPSGGCALFLHQCSPGFVCPHSAPLLCEDGSCVTDISMCYDSIQFNITETTGNVTTLDIPSLSLLLIQECPNAFPYYCKNTHTCVQSSDVCMKSPICPTASPVLCSNGFCVSSSSLCAVQNVYTCPKGLIMCQYSKTCVDRPSLCPSVITCSPSETQCGNIGCYPILTSEYVSTQIYPFNYTNGHIYKEGYIDIQYYHSTGDEAYRHQIETCITNYLDIFIDTCNKYTSIEKTTCIENLRTRYQNLCVRSYLYYPCSRYNLQYTNNIFYMYDIYPSFTYTGDPISNVYKNVTSNESYFDPALFLLTADENITTTMPKPLCLSSQKRCFDGSCVDINSSCPSYRICPRDKPVLCADGTCQYHSDYCLSNTHCPSNYKLCSDGSCLFSTQKCPTVTCPEDRPFLCWDHSCRVIPNECPDEPERIYSDCTTYDCIYNANSINSNDKSQFCSIYSSYIKDRSQCLTTYLSFDRTVVHQGILTSFCAYNMYLCPDGTCVSKKSNCHLPLCPILYPYHCPDGSCVKTSSECPQTSCSSNQFYAYCTNSWKCITTVEDEDITLTYQHECSNICDVNYVTCFDGSCASSYDVCPLYNGCTKDKPILCKDGSCVASNTECSVSCVSPFILCPNGMCMLSKSQCLFNVYTTLDLIITPSPEHILSEKDMILSESQKATLQNEQNIEHPNFFAEDNTTQVIMSIDNSDTTESTFTSIPPSVPRYDTTWFIDRNKLVNYVLALPNVCSEDKPIRCFNGLCVKESKDCPVLMPCNTTYYNDNFIRCYDGSCKSSLSLCSKRTICVSPYNYMCTTGKYNGMCVEDESLCLNDDGCPQSVPHKCASGLCVASHFDCGVSQTPNPCPVNTPYKCLTGKCVAEPQECTYFNGCSPLRPIKCPNGDCVASKSECSFSSDSNYVHICPKSNMYVCKDGTCVENPGLCKSNNQCDLLHPIRCAAGMCISAYGQLVSPSLASIYQLSDKIYTWIQPSNSTTFTQCPKKPLCPKDIPFLCDDLSCVADSKLCKPCFECTITESSLPFCPSFLPIQCQDGTCVSNQGDCERPVRCPASRPFMCYTGECASSPFFCEYVSLETYNSLPMPPDNITLCSDGTYRPISLCPPIPSCPLNAPKRCANGMCVDSNISCEKTFINFNGYKHSLILGISQTVTDTLARDLIRSDINITSAAVMIPIRENGVYVCPLSHYHLCEDGICRTSCPNSLGCGLSAYTCMDFTCIAFNPINEMSITCKGLYNCPKDMYRCVDNSCHYSISECPHHSAFTVFPAATYITLTGVETDRLLLKSLQNTNIGYIRAAQAQIHPKNHPIFLMLNELSLYQLNNIRYKAENHTRLEELNYLPYVTTQIKQTMTINENELYLSTPMISIGSVVNISFVDIQGYSIHTLESPIEVGLFYDCHISILPRVYENLTFYKNPLDISEDEYCMARYNSLTHEWLCLEDINYRFERCLIAGSVQTDGLYTILLRPKAAKGLYTYVPDTVSDPYQIYWIVGTVLYILLLFLAIYIFIIMNRYRTRWEFMSKAYKSLKTAHAEDLIEDQWNSETQEWINSGVELKDRGKYKITENRYAFEKQQSEKIEENWKLKYAIAEKNESIIRKLIQRIQGLRTYYISLYNNEMRGINRSNSDSYLLSHSQNDIQFIDSSSKDYYANSDEGINHRIMNQGENTDSTTASVLLDNSHSFDSNYNRSDPGYGEENTSNESQSIQPVLTSKFDSLLDTAVNSDIQQSIKTRTLSTATYLDFLNSSTITYNRFNSIGYSGDERDMSRGLSVSSMSGLHRDTYNHYRDSSISIVRHHGSDSSIGLEMDIGSMAVDSDTNYYRDNDIDTHLNPHDDVNNHISSIAMIRQRGSKHSEGHSNSRSPSRSDQPYNGNQNHQRINRSGSNKSRSMSKHLSNNPNSDVLSSSASPTYRHTTNSTSQNSYPVTKYTHISSPDPSRSSSSDPASKHPLDSLDILRGSANVMLASDPNTPDLYPLSGAPSDSNTSTTIKSGPPAIGGKKKIKKIVKRTVKSKRPSSVSHSSSATPVSDQYTNTSVTPAEYSNTECSTDTETIVKRTMLSSTVPHSSSPSLSKYIPQHASVTFVTSSQSADRTSLAITSAKSLRDISLQSEQHTMSEESSPMEVTPNNRDSEEISTVSTLQGPSIRNSLNRSPYNNDSIRSSLNRSPYNNDSIRNSCRSTATDSTALSNEDYTQISEILPASVINRIKKQNMAVTSNNHISLTAIPPDDPSLLLGKRSITNLLENENNSDSTTEDSNTSNTSNIINNDK